MFAPRSAESASTLGRLLGIAAPTLTDVRAADYAMFGDIDFRHPLFAPFADPHYSDFTKIHIWNYRRLQLDALPGARALARFDSGDPALVEVGVGSGRLLVLLTGWNPEDSQLAVSSKFVPLLDSLLEYAGGPADEPSQYFVGDPLPLHPAGGAPSRVVAPDGTATQLPAEAASFAGARTPGIYLLENGPRHWRVAVNVAASESRTEPLAPDQLERYALPARRARRIRRAPPSAGRSWPARTPRAGRSSGAGSSARPWRCSCSNRRWPDGQRGEMRLRSRPKGRTRDGRAPQIAPETRGPAPALGGAWLAAGRLLVGGRAGRRRLYAGSNAAGLVLALDPAACSPRSPARRRPP